MNADTLPVDELPNGLPLFNLFLHVPAFEAKLQLFRLVRSYVVERFTLHTLLVHPQEVDALPTLAGTLGFLQLHGEVWELRDGTVDNRCALTIGRTGRPYEYAITAPDDRTVCLVDATGTVATRADRHTFLGDDLTKVRFLRECFLSEYADDALSVPLVRCYPGRTSLITSGRVFPRLFRTDPVGPATRIREPTAWTAPA